MLILLIKILPTNKLRSKNKVDVISEDDLCQWKPAIHLPVSLPTNKMLCLGLEPTPSQSYLSSSSKLMQKHRKVYHMEPGKMPTWRWLEKETDR